MVRAAVTWWAEAAANSSWLITVVPSWARALRHTASHAPSTSARLRPQALCAPRTSRAARNIRSSPPG